MILSLYDIKISLFITGEIQILEMMAERKEAVDKEKGKPIKQKQAHKTEV